MHIIDKSTVLSAPLPVAVARVLVARRDLIAHATFVVVTVMDSKQAVEEAIGFPIAEDYPPWEWVLDHGGAFEAPIITSDDGHATVLLVPDCDAINATLLAILRQHSERPDTISETGDMGS